MSQDTRFRLALLCLVSFTVAAVAILVGFPAYTSRGPTWFIGALCGALAFGCAVVVAHLRAEEIDDLIRVHHREMSKVADREQAMAKRRDELVGQIVEAASYIYVNREPTNGSIAPVRRFLVKAAIDELQAGAPVKIVTDRADSSEVISDVVRSEMKPGGVVDLSKGEKWQGELVQFALMGKPAPETVSHKSAA